MLDQTIALFCLSIVSNIYDPACNKAGQAFVTQTDIKTDYEKTQTYLIVKTKGIADNSIGNTGEAIGYTAYEIGYRKRLAVPIDLNPTFSSFKVIEDFRGNTTSLNVSCDLDHLFKLFDNK